jgi:hypothetical protein
MISHLIGFIALLIYGAYVIFVSIRNIRIGSGKIQHPLYDTPRKKKMMLIKGWVCGVVSLLCSMFFAYLTILYVIIFVL